MARVEVSLAGAVSEINSGTRGTRTFYTPEEFGAAGDGVTVDDDAIATAITAANGQYPVVFTKTYLYGGSTGGGVITIPNTHIIIQKGATLKQKSDGGTRQFGGLFYIQADHVLIENYGTMDGNKSEMSATTYAGYSGVISAFAQGHGFTYRNHGSGVIQNTVDAGIVMYQVEDVTIDGMIFKDGPGVTTSNRYSIAAILLQECPRATVDHFHMFDSPTPTGVKMISPSMDGLCVRRSIVDWRGQTLVDTGDSPAAGYNGFEMYSTGSGSNNGNLTTGTELLVYGSEDVATGQLVIGVAGFAIINNCHILGDSGSVNSITFAIECAVNTWISNCTLRKCLVGILTQEENCKATDTHIISSSSSAIQTVTSNDFDFDVTVEDCGGSTSGGSFSPWVFNFTTAGIGGRLRFQANYNNLDQDIVLVGSDQSFFTIEDSLVRNAMANSHSIYLSLLGNNNAIINSTFVGKGDVGTCITLTGAGNRIVGNHFKDYLSPWDTSAGTYTLLTGNVVESCTGAGSTDATDTSANNMVF